MAFLRSASAIRPATVSRSSRSSPLTNCLFRRAMAQAHPEVDQSWHGADGDENHDKSLVRAIVGPDQDQKTPAARDGLSGSPGPDQQAHEQPEIVPGDMDQIALVDILATPQPRPAQTT